MGCGTEENVGPVDTKLITAQMKTNEAVIKAVEALLPEFGAAGIRNVTISESCEHVIDGDGYLVMDGNFPKKEAGQCRITIDPSNENVGRGNQLMQELAQSLAQQGVEDISLGADIERCGGGGLTNLLGGAEGPSPQSLTGRY